MRATKIPLLALGGLAVLCFGLAARLDPWFQAWQGSRTAGGDVFGVLLGDARRMFARQFFVKADAYFHSGFYPSIFDNRAAFETPHMAEDAGAVAGHNQGEEASFLGPPQDWLDQFSRQFFPSEHTHLDQGGAQGEKSKADNLGESAKVGEILPWLRISSALDPDCVETYTVTAYWLRRRMGKPAEAEQFLRQGLRVNPNSYEILYELGRVYAEDRHDGGRARNLWEAALRNWQRQERGKTEPDEFMFTEIVSHLAVEEEAEGDYQAALVHMEQWKARSRNPAEQASRIAALEQKLAAAAPKP